MSFRSRQLSKSGLKYEIPMTAVLGSLWTTWENEISHNLLPRRPTLPTISCHSSNDPRWLSVIWRERTRIRRVLKQQALKKERTEFEGISRLRDCKFLNVCIPAGRESAEFFHNESESSCSESNVAMGFNWMTQKRSGSFDESSGWRMLRRRRDEAYVKASHDCSDRGPQYVKFWMAGHPSKMLWSNAASGML